MTSRVLVAGDRSARVHASPKTSMQLHVHHRDAAGKPTTRICKPLENLDGINPDHLLDVPDSDSGLAQVRLRIAELVGPAYVVTVERRHGKEFVIDCFVQERFAAMADNGGAT